MPAFWSTQFGVNIKSVEIPSFSDSLTVTQGSMAERRFVAAFGHRGRIAAAVAFDEGGFTATAPSRPGPALTAAW